MAEYDLLTNGLRRPNVSEPNWGTHLNYSLDLLDALKGAALDSADLAPYQPLSQKGAANGYASLDGTGKVPSAQIPTTANPEDIATFAKTGTLAVGAGTGRFRFPWAATILGVTAAVNTAPTGASLIADVNKNGTTIFTTQSNRPTITATTNATTSEPTPGVTAIVAGDYLTVDIDQIGSTVAGADLTVFVRYRKT